MKTLRTFEKILSENNKKIIENCKDAPRILDYYNRLGFINIKRIYKGKNKGKFWIFISVNVGDLTLEKLGYRDNWSKKTKNVIEQFNILASKDDLIKLQEDLKQIFTTPNYPKRIIASKRK